MRLALPRITAPAWRSLVMTVASLDTVVPWRIYDPAIWSVRRGVVGESYIPVLLMRSHVAMLFLTRSGMPCHGLVSGLQGRVKKYNDYSESKWCGLPSNNTICPLVVQRFGNLYCVGVDFCDSVQLVVYLVYTPYICLVYMFSNKITRDSVEYTLTRLTLVKWPLRNPS